MKKIYSFIALMLMCFAGNANAQDAPMSWNYAEESVSEADFLGGEDHYYVLQEGDNTNEAGESGGHSASGFLSCLGGCTADVTTNNVFKFILTGEEKEGHPIYVLKSVAKDAYLAQSGSYVKYTAEAFKFTVQKAVSFAEADMLDSTPWSEYSCAVSSTRSVNAVDLGAWVMCSPDSRTYIAFYGDPGFHPYIDTNNWLIKVATPEEMPIADQFTAIFNQYFEDFGTKEDVAAAYPVGNNPGYVTQELQNNLTETFDAAYNMLLDGATEEAYKAMIDRINKLFTEDMQKGLIQVAPGYFILKNIDNQQRGFLTVTADGKKGRGNKALAFNNVVEGTTYADWTLESTTEWNLNNAKYIWKVEKDAKDGKFLFKNFGTGKYLASTEEFTMNDKPAGAYGVENYQGMEFYLTLQNGKIMHVANHSDNKLMTYNADDPASRWYFYTVNQEIIDSLTSKVAQSALNDELKAAVANAKSDFYSLQYANYVEGDMYVAGDSGLVTSMYKYNSMATQEGGADKLFDGDMKSYFHTAWNASDVEAQGTEIGGTHWIKVDLGKEVSNLKVKFTKRQGAANGHVSQYALYALPDGDVAESGELGELVAESADSIAFQFGNENTHIADYQLSKPTRFLRFEVKQTRGRDSTTWNAMTAETGPFWHMSELRFYDPQDIKENPAYAAIPADVKAALKAVIEKAEAELKEKKAQQTTIDELEAALKKYWDCYPDPTELKNTLEAAADMASNAAEGDGVGFYETGAKDALLEVVNALQAEVDAKEEANAPFSLEELKANMDKLEKAMADFNAKLQLPEAGKVYMMVGKSLAPADAEGNFPPQVDGLIASVNADVMNGSPVFRYSTTDDAIDGRFNALWLVEKTETGLAFKNLANGLYMNNVYDGLTEEEIEDLKLPNNQIGWSKTPKSFTLEQFTKEGQGENGYFVMTLMKGQYLNFQQDGRVMVHYGERNDNNAPFIFEEADQAMTFEGNYNIDVEAGKTQILSFPVALESVTNNDWEPYAYQVLGKKDNKILLSLIEGPIAAGTPFIIQTKAANAEEGTEAETRIQANLVGTSIEDNLDLEYNYSPVIVNGLVSTPNSEALAAGYGVIVGNKVIPCEEGRRAVAGSGVFNKNIPATEENSEFFIETEGEITAGGDATAVENVVIVKNVPADVYTISGVKVRNNVKLSNATQGLPKGVYIVGGKKVIVK